MLKLAAGTMIAAVLAQHMGLTEAVARTLLKVASCPKCCAFWLTLSVLVLKGYGLTASAAAAIGAAYVAQWAGLGLFHIYRQYQAIWQRIQSPASRTGRRQRHRRSA